MTTLKNITRACIYSCHFYLALLPTGFTLPYRITPNAVRFYRTISPLPLKKGGIFSVALSLKLPWPSVTRRCVLLEPGLSSLTHSVTALAHLSESLCY
ncbi:hypothetical protein HCUR_00531 [Holospora curviuscula]|uniref:Uncharacterized protein n=1 Tax=Holospora curviuscula TaxID=1082868 RepID=A0A2S5R9J3_9PROT|nr:hypothetical protein HCUR_00531 [Holospora curviuscula]